MLSACRQEDPEAGPDAGRGDHRSPAVPAQEVLHQALQEVSRRGLPEPWWLALTARWSERFPAEQAPARHPVQPDARRQDVAALRHARRAQPEAHPVDAVARARSLAHRRVVSRWTEQVRRPELAESAVPCAQPEELSVQAVASARPSELPQVAAEEEEAQLSVPRVAAEAQPWVQPEEAAVEALPSVVRVVEAVQPSAAQAVAEVRRVVVPAAEVELLAAERAAEVELPSVVQVAAQLSAVQQVARAQPLEARAVRPLAELSAEPSRPREPAPARRRMTTLRREPVLAKAEWQRSPSSSAE